MAEQLSFEDFPEGKAAKPKIKEAPPALKSVPLAPIAEVKEKDARSVENDDEDFDCPVGCNTMPCDHYRKGRSRVA